MTFKLLKKYILKSKKENYFVITKKKLNYDF
jgi:hypothetical protein